MSINTISNIDLVYVNNSVDRWLVTTNKNYYRWNNFNQSYEIINAPSFPQSSYIYQNSSLGSDSQGNTYLLQSYQNTADFSASSISIFNALTNSFQDTININISSLSISDSNFKDLLIIDSGEIWLLNSIGLIYQLELVNGNYPVPTLLQPALELTVNSFTIGKEDGSIWALDSNGVIWTWDGTNFNLFNQGTNPALKQLSVIDINHIYGLGTDGKIYQWSIGSNSFIDLSNLLNSVPPILEQIQVDEQGILYGISTQNQSYQLFNTASVVDISNPNTQPNGLTTITTNSGVTHAIWNENGQIYYGYSNADHPGKYIGVAPLGSGIGATPQGSSTDLNLINNGGNIQAYWLSSDGNDTEVYSSSLSSSPYGGYQWSNPQNLTNDNLADSNLEVTALENNQVLITTQKQGITSHQIVDTSQLTSIPVNNTS
jgi:hypothetical protein